jgi:hypothetical protein
MQDNIRNICIIILCVAFGFSLDLKNEINRNYPEAKLIEILTTKRRELNPHLLRKFTISVSVLGLVSLILIIMSIFF